MSTRASAIDRVLTFYRTASPDTVRVTHTLAVEVMADRGIGGGKKVKQIVRRGRRSKSATSQTEVATGTAAASSSGGN